MSFELVKVSNALGSFSLGIIIIRVRMIIILKTQINPFLSDIPISIDILLFFRHDQILPILQLAALLLPALQLLIYSPQLCIIL